MNPDKPIPEQTFTNHPQEPGEGAEQENDRGDRSRVEERKTDTQRGHRFPIVGLGASAGGLKAFSTFFENLPEQPDMAFVLVQHLDPHHESELASLLQNYTSMQVTQVEDRTKANPNQVYVIPPGKSLSIKNGVLHLSEPNRPRGQRAPIDLFFRSLAEDQGENAVCIILSGTGSDGSLGLKTIKESGGVVMAQLPEEAEYNGMPQNAINTGLVDLVAPVAELARKLVEYQRSAERMQFPETVETLAKDDADSLQRIFAQLQNLTGHDFSHYKRSTILRRIQRRMQVTQSESLPSYLKLLRNNHDEAIALFKDFLISVTNFFRDEEAFSALKEEIIPALFDNRDSEQPIRVWVPGCATGEEAYSIAMLLIEEVTRREESAPVQVFATDLDNQALNFARAAVYPDAITADVSPERLRRFFKEEHDGYHVSKELQDIVLFAPHNLIKDAPFARLDLISCRNLLIYLNRDVQEQIFRIFHYALKPDGYLFLGSSESADLVFDLFNPVRKRQRIYKRRDAPTSLPRLPMVPLVENKVPEANMKSATDGKEPSLRSLHRDLMLQRYAPPSVIVDADYQIRYMFGDVGRYLQRREGEPSDNILENLTPEIRVEVRTGLFSIFRNKEALKPRRVKFAKDGHIERLLIKLETVRSEGNGEPMALVIFEPLPLPKDTTDVQEDRQVDHAVVQQLEDELKETRHRLQTTIEEYETSNEELKASNEELQSMNEELRSTAEELETGREELQSTNEELSSVNQELKNKIEEVNRANSDLENLMEATDIPILFLDRDLRLKRYTPEATDLFNIIPSDLGRPFAHISHKIDHGKLPPLAEHVLKTLETIEEEVRSHDGRWFLLHMHPYRTVEDKIEGVVVTLVDITVQIEAAQQQRTFARQQAAVAELGLMALNHHKLQDLMDMAARQVAEILSVDYTKVLELMPDEENLLLKAGVGWQEDLVGQTTVGSGLDSQAGYTLRSDQPVIVEDLRVETRFRGSALLSDHGVVSGISVIIHGPERPYGILGVHTREKRLFTERDVDVLQAVANTLATAVQHHRAQTEREVLLARIKSERERLQNIFWQAPAAIAMFEGPEHIYTFMNQLHLSMVHHRKVIGKTVREAFPELKGQGIFELMDEVYQTGETKVIPETPIRFDWRGTGVVETAYHDVVYSPYRDGDGRVTGVMGFGFDVTDKVMARQQIDDERRRLETVLEQMPAAVIIAEAPSGKLVMGNKQVEEIWERPYVASDDIEGYRAYRGFHPGDGRPYKPEEWPLARAITTGEITRAEEIIFERDDGSRGVQSVSAAPIRNSEGEIVAGVVIFQDVTKRKQVEMERKELLKDLQDREQVLQAVLDQMPSGLLIAEAPSGKLMLYNKETERLLQHSIPETNSHEDYAQYNAFHANGEPYKAQDYPIVRALFGEVVRQEEMIYGRTDGKLVTLSANAAPVRDEEGSIIMAVSTFQDISTIKRLQDELEAWNRQLEERVDERTSQIRELASALAVAEQRERERVSQILHDDLQQLLHALKIHLHMLETEVSEAKNESLHGSVEEAEELTSRALSITRSLTVELSPPVLENEGLVQSLDWLAQHMAKIHGLEVEITVSGEPAIAYKDVEELAFQMVRELLFNIVKHAEVDFARVNIWQEDKWCKIKVADNGKGFDVANLKERKRHGYGLFNIRERIHLFGGDLKIESKPGNGTVVTLQFPSRSNEP